MLRESAVRKSDTISSESCIAVICVISGRMQLDVSTPFSAR